MIRNLLVLKICTVLFCYAFGSPELLVSEKQNVRIVDAASADKETPPLFQNEQLMTNIYMDYHYSAGLICWSDINELTIQCVRVSQPQEQVLFLSGLSQPEGIAIDWLSDVLYWVDSKTEKVEVVGLTAPHHRKVLYWTDLTKVNAITLVPSEGLMFWSTWSSQASKIEIASMGGSDSDKPSSRKVLISTDLRWPNGLTCDTQQRLLYWVDAQQQNQDIEVVDFDGNGRRKILNEGLEHPFGLSYFNRSLYWTDWNTQAVHTCTFTRENVCRNQHAITHSSTVNYVRVYSEQLQPTNQSSPCRQHACSHLCLHTPSDAHSKRLFGDQTSSLPGSTIRTYSEPKVAAKCACPTGITLLPGERTCRSSPQRFLLLARTVGLFTVSLDTEDFSVLPLGGASSNETKHDATDVDYDPVNNEIFWVDDELRAVRASKEYEGSIIVTRTILEDIGLNDGFALDVSGRNFYWTDEKNHCIYVASMDGTARKVVVWTDLDRPRAVTVHTTRNLIFWTDWGDKPKIEKAGVDGSLRTIIVDQRLGWPNGIVLDEANEIVYWIDGLDHTVERCKFDGTGREMLLKDDHLQHISGLTLLHSKLYWPEQVERMVYVLDVGSKPEGSYERKSVLRNTPNISNIKAVERLTALPQYDNSNSADSLSYNSNDTLHDVPCFVNKSGCSHICFRKLVGSRLYYCSCPSDMDLSADNHTCVHSKNFLLYGGGKFNLNRVSLSPPYHSQGLPVTPIKSTTSLAYDSVTEMVYRSDSISRSIWRSHLNGTNSETVVRHGLLLPHSIAVEHVSRNLYWADMELNRIEVCRLDGSSRRALVWDGIVKPYSIAVEPYTRFLYWSELGSESGVIKRAWLDGSHREVLVSSGVGHEVFLSVARLSNSQVKIYWAETEPHTGVRQISSCDSDGANRKVMLPKVPGCVGVNLWQDELYWAQWEQGSMSSSTPDSFTIYSVNTLNPNLKPSIIKNYLNLTGFVFTVAGDNSSPPVSSLTPSNPCTPNNGGCSHLCLPNPPLSSSSPHDSHCACPTHYKLDPTDHSSCLPPTSFLVYARVASISRLLDPDEVEGVTECPSIVLSLKGVRNVGGVEYDPLTHTIYWLDTKNKKVLAAQEDVFKKQVIVGKAGDAVVHPNSLALDHVSGLLYVSCSEHNTINASRLDIVDGTYIYTNLGIVVGLPLDKPRAVAVHSYFRLLFFINMAAPAPLLERCRLDGSQRRVLVYINSNSVERVVLTVDNSVTDPRVYWYDSSTNKIETCDIEGGSRRVLVSSSLQRVLSMTVLGQWLYWVDADTNKVEKMNIHSSVRATVLDRISDLIAITAVDVTLAHEHHPCSRVTESPLCSQICLMGANDTTLQQSVAGHTSPPLTSGRGDPLYGSLMREGIGATSPYTRPVAGYSLYHRGTSSPAVTLHPMLPGYGAGHNGLSLAEYNSAMLLSSSQRALRHQYGNNHEVSAGAAAFNNYYDGELEVRNRGDGNNVPVSLGECGCVYGEVLYGNGQECEPCYSTSSQKHFICSDSPLQCIHAALQCDGIEHCNNGADEQYCSAPLPPPPSNKTAYTVGIAVCVLVLLCLAALLVYYRRRPPIEDALMMAAAAAGASQGKQSQLLHRGGVNGTIKASGVYRAPQPSASLSSCQQRLLPPDTTTCSATCLNSTCGASGCGPNGTAGGSHLLSGTEMYSLSASGVHHASSSSSSTTHYPKETINPPPTPTIRQPQPSGCVYPHPLQVGALPRHLITTPPHYHHHHHHGIADHGRYHMRPAPGGLTRGVTSMGYSAASSRPPQAIPLGGNNPHSYRHYKSRNRPPPPTPCSTDVCDDSDVNSTTLITASTPPSYCSDTNEPHHHPNSPNTTQYCSLSSLPRACHYYCDCDEPHPPPPTPQTAPDEQPSNVCYIQDSSKSPEEEDERGLLLNGTVSPTDTVQRYYCPPPPSPVASD